MVIRSPLIFVINPRFPHIKIDPLAHKRCTYSNQWNWCKGAEPTIYISQDIFSEMASVQFPRDVRRSNLSCWDLNSQHGDGGAMAAGCGGDGGAAAYAAPVSGSPAMPSITKNQANREPRRMGRLTGRPSAAQARRRWDTPRQRTVGRRRGAVDRRGSTPRQLGLTVCLGTQSIRRIGVCGARAASSAGQTARSKRTIEFTSTHSHLAHAEHNPMLP